MCCGAASGKMLRCSRRAVILWLYAPAKERALRTIPIGPNSTGLIMSCALSQDDADYNSMYDVTSFFAGVSDDFTYGEMVQVLESAYGKVPDAAWAGEEL